MSNEGASIDVNSDLSTSTGPTLDPAVTETCLAIIQDHRTGQCDKIEAILRLQTAIPRAGNEDSAYIAAFRSYVKMLENFDQLGTSQTAGGLQSGQGGQTGDGVLGANGTGISGGDGESGDRLNEQTHAKRARTPTDDDAGPKKRLDTSVLPWLIEEEIDPPVLTESLQKTRTALENFSRDIKGTKALLTNSARCPQFPDSQWTNLLSGKAVDLDDVLSNGYTLEYDSRTTERLGDIEIRVNGSAKPARTVDTHGKWRIAWDQTVDATLYIFPHRASELQEYGRHISSFFASFPEHLHMLIVRYDRAVRMRQAQKRNLELTNYAAFADLHSLWVLNGGAGVGAGGAPAVLEERKPKHAGKRREACRRWNDKRCPHNANSCNYAHVCAKCRSNTHAFSDCPTRK